MNDDSSFVERKNAERRWTRKPSQPVLPSKPDAWSDDDSPSGRSAPALIPPHDQESIVSTTSLKQVTFAPLDGVQDDEVLASRALKEDESILNTILSFKGAEVAMGEEEIADLKDPPTSAIEEIARMGMTAPKYEKADLEAYVKSNDHLDLEQQIQLLSVLYEV